MIKKHCPIIYENFKAYSDDKDKKSSIANEYILYSDTHITGELSNEKVMGPYKLINLIPTPTNTTCLKPSIVFRTDYYISNSKQLDFLNELFKENRTTNEFYHGGYIQDEMAALLSLFLGVRIKAGGISRYFSPDIDSRGKPRGPKLNREPILFPPSNQSFIIPGAFGTHSLNRAEKCFADFFELQELDASAIIQSARYYQEALWVAESSPQLSWLYFTSAVEKASSHWNQGKCSSFEAFKELNETFYNSIKSKCNSEVLTLIAKEFGKLYKKQVKFTKFLITFFPKILEKSNETSQYPYFAWNEANIRKAFKIIYDHRSSALHNCIPFPLPMCEPPHEIINNDIKYSEIPPGLAMGTYDSVWKLEDTPMLLHTFEYIVHNAILNWLELVLVTKKSK